MSRTFRDYAVAAMRTLKEGALQGGGDVEISEVFMDPDSEKPESGAVTFDFEGRHFDGTTVMGEVVFRTFNIEGDEDEDY